MVNTSILTVGKLCELLQAGPAQIKAAAARAGVQPALMVNGQSYYHESDLAKIRENLTEEKS